MKFVTRFFLARPTKCDVHSPDFSHDELERRLPGHASHTSLFYSSSSSAVPHVHERYNICMYTNTRTDTLTMMHAGIFAPNRSRICRRELDPAETVVAQVMMTRYSLGGEEPAQKTRPATLVINEHVAKRTQEEANDDVHGKPCQGDVREEQ